MFFEVGAVLSGLLTSNSYFLLVSLFPQICASCCLQGALGGGGRGLTQGSPLLAPSSLWKGVEGGIQGSQAGLKVRPGPLPTLALDCYSQLWEIFSLMTILKLNKTILPVWPNLSINDLPSVSIPSPSHGLVSAS